MVSQVKKKLANSGLYINSWIISCWKRIKILLIRFVICLIVKLSISTFYKIVWISQISSNFQFPPDIYDTRMYSITMSKFKFSNNQVLYHGRFGYVGFIIFNGTKYEMWNYLISATHVKNIKYLLLKS